MERTHLSLALRALRDRSGLSRDACVVRFSNLGRQRSLSTIRMWETTGSIRFDDADFYVTRVLGVRMDELYREIENQRRLNPNP